MHSEHLPGEPFSPGLLCLNITGLSGASCLGTQCPALPGWKVAEGGTLPPTPPPSPGCLEGRVRDFGPVKREFSRNSGGVITSLISLQ